MRSANITWYCSRRRKGSASEEQTFQWEGIPLCQQPWEARTPTHFWPWRTWNMEQTQKSNKNKVLAERIQLALGKEKNQRKESEKKTKNIGECAALGRGVLEPRASMGVMEGAGRKRNVQRSVGGAESPAGPHHTCECAHTHTQLTGWLQISALEKAVTPLCGNETNGHKNDSRPKRKSHLAKQETGGLF